MTGQQIRHRPVSSRLPFPGGARWSAAVRAFAACPHRNRIRGNAYTPPTGASREAARVRIQELEERLVECGLTEKESAIYLLLAQQGSMKASDVGKRVGISRMDAYNNLRALQQRGIVEATLEKPMRFFVLPVDQALDLLIAEKRAELDRTERNKEIFPDRLPPLPS